MGVTHRTSALPGRSVFCGVARTLGIFAGLLALGLAMGCEDTPVRPAGSDRLPDGSLGTDVVSATPGREEGVTAAEAPAPRPRGLWVLCEGSQRVLEDIGRLEALIENAERLGASDLFVQVYRGGRAWYDATLADTGPYQKILAATGTDTLALLIERAHAKGMRVHAWVNVLSLSGNADAMIVRELGPASVHVDQRGRSLLDYPNHEVPEPDLGWYRMGTRGVYLDPGSPGVAGWLSATFAELVTRYPGLDGLHLDYIRHPDVLPFIPGSRFGVGLEFGYGELSRDRFREETALQAPFGGRIVNSSRWDAWRRDKVTELVTRIRQETRAASPNLHVSAAVASHVDRAYLSMAQDWKRWLEDGLLEFAVAMVYTLDDRLFRYQVASFATGPDGDRIWAGVGSWLFASRPARAVEQIEIARREGMVGEALFSYDSIADAPALLSALSIDAPADPAEPPVPAGLAQPPVPAGPADPAEPAD